jgi:hypothetical protein
MQGLSAYACRGHMRAHVYWGAAAAVSNVSLLGVYSSMTTAAVLQQLLQ